MERKLSEATTRSCELGILLHALQSGSDEESTMLLARLRMGESLDNVVSSLLTPKDETVGAVLAQTHTQNERVAPRRYVSFIPTEQNWLKSNHNSVVPRQVSRSKRGMALERNANAGHKLLPAKPVHATQKEESHFMTEERLSATIVHQEPSGSQSTRNSACEDAK